MKQPKTLFYCTECGNETPKWAGRCPACGAWNTVVECPESPVKGKGRSIASSRAVAAPRALPVTELGDSAEIRFSTGMGELDRVLGGVLGPGGRRAGHREVNPDASNLRQAL